MEQVNPVYNYTVEQLAGNTKFTYKKKLLSYWAAGPFCFYAAFFAIFTTSVLQPSSVSSAITLWLFTVLAFAFGTVALINYFKEKQSGEFTITKDSVIVEGKNYSLDHVKAFSIKDPEGGYVSNSSSVLVYHSNTLAGNVHAVSHAMGNVSKEVGNALRKHMKATQYKIVIRYATKDVVIANGLGELEAESLFDKVTEIAGYTKSV